MVVDRAVAADFIPKFADTMGADCELRGDADAVAIDGRLKQATEEDWNTEYLDPIASVKIVDGLDEGIAWVEAHSSHHTDAILTEDDVAARKFMTSIDSAIVTRAIMARRKGRSRRRSAALQQDGRRRRPKATCKVKLPAGAGPGAGEDGAGVRTNNGTNSSLGRYCS